MKFIPSLMVTLLYAGIILVIASIPVCVSLSHINVPDLRGFSNDKENTMAILRLPDGSTKQVTVKRWIGTVCDMVVVETENEVYLTHSVNLVLIKDK